MLGAVVGAGAGAAGVHIGALPLLQRRPVGMSVASIRYMGHKDVVVLLPLWINSAIMPKFATFLSCMCSLFEKVLTYTPVGVLVDNKILKILKS